MLDARKLIIFSSLLAAFSVIFLLNLFKAKGITGQVITSSSISTSSLLSLALLIGLAIGGLFGLTVLYKGTRRY